MATPIGTILRRSFRQPNENYNCITFPTHERYQSGLANTKCNFYMLQGTPGVKGNGWIESYAIMPDNHILLEKRDNPLQAIPSWIDGIDFTIGQHRYGQGQTAIELANFFSCSSIILEHTVPTNDNIRVAIPQMKQVRGDINVFISRSSCEAWGWSPDDPAVEIIEHGVNTDLFKPTRVTSQQPHILCIVNDWVNRGDILGWDIFQRVCVANHLPVKVLGDNPGISQPARNVYELVQAYNSASVFYNTSRHSPIPTVILESMACGVPVVSTDNYLISEVIVNGVNGYRTNSEAEQLKHLRRLLLDKDEHSELGQNARQTILDRFPLSNFVKNWNRVFDRVIGENK